MPTKNNHAVEYKSKTAKRWTKRAFSTRSAAVDFAEKMKKKGYSVKVMAFGNRARFGSLG
jgi:hypothetical protein